MRPDVKTHARKPRVAVCERSIKIIKCWLLRKDDVITAIPVPSLHSGEAKPRIAANVDDQQRDEYEKKPLHKRPTLQMVPPSNENKMSDGWRKSASLRFHPS